MAQTSETPVTASGGIRVSQNSYLDIVKFNDEDNDDDDNNYDYFFPSKI